MLRSRKAPPSSSLSSSSASSLSSSSPSSIRDSKKRPGPQTPPPPSPGSRLCLSIVAMALLSSLLAAAYFLFLFLGSRTDPSAAASDLSSPIPTKGIQVTFGSVIKLMHERTKFRLHSHEVPYGSGSGQQSVTGFEGVDDSNSYWIVTPPEGSNSKQGEALLDGTIFRLQHMRTRRWLHSHLHPSPITGNYEVSCFGGDGESDTGDNWRLELESKGKVWLIDQKLRLHHIDTGGFLHSHDRKYNRIATGQQEVCGMAKKSNDNLWITAEGVFVPAK